MGHFDPATNHVVQELDSAVGGTWSLPGYWNGHVYYWGSGDVLKAFDLTGDSTQPLTTSPSAQGPDAIGFPGATPSISANGTQGGIVWALQSDAFQTNGPAVLRAYDASNVSTALFDSSRRAADNPGPAVKFTVPTVVNGRVYVGTQTRLSVYGLPSVQFHAANVSTIEGNKTVLVAVTRTGVLTSVAMVDYATSAGTAVAGLNFTPTTGTLTFNPGVVTQMLPVQVLKQSGYQGATAVLLSLTNPQGAVLGEPRTAVLTIHDADPAPGAFMFSASSFSVSETAASATITVRRTGGTAGTVGVTYALTDGTAVDGTDYTATTATLSFQPGAAVRSFSVPILKNPAHNGDLTVNLALSAPTNGATLGVPATAILTIRTADPTFAFAAATSGVDQGRTKATITVRRFGSLVAQGTVNYAMADGTAVNGVDYNASSGTLTFKTGVASQIFPVSIIPKATTTHEGDRTVALSLSSPSGGFLGTPSSATLTIVDPIPAARIQFSTAIYSVGETHKTATITVTRSGPTSTALSVDYATSAGTAVAGTNYTSTSGTLLFLPNQSLEAFTVPILDDGVTTGNVSVGLTLGNAQGDSGLGQLSAATLWIIGEP
jgi:hypothetical protein